MRSIHRLCFTIAFVTLAVAMHGLTLTAHEPNEAWRAKRRTEMTNPERLFSRGGPNIHRGEYLGDIRLPVGGVGVGSVQMDGQGRRVAWQLWRNFTEFTLPHSLFAVRASVGNKPPVVRVLQTVGEGPLPAMKALSFRGEYPFGWYEFDDPDLPVQVSLEVYSPMIPLDAKNSAIPCAIYNLTVENRGKNSVDVSFLATQQNAAGLVDTMPPDPNPGRRLVLRRPPEQWTVTGRSSKQYGGNTNKVVRTDEATLLHMTGKHPKDSPAYGEMVLATTNPDANASASWKDFEALCDEFAKTGRVSGHEEAGPSPEGETLDGALATPFVIKPGEKRTVCFVLTWYFPNIPMVLDENCPKWDHSGYVYSNWWPDGLSLARDVLARLDKLTAQTRRYHESFYSSNMPYWLLDRISSQVAILSSATCFWAKDDHFGCWEGCSWTYGSCAGNATHVWGYAQAVPRLFPSLGKRMRQQEHNELSPEGMLPVRLGMRRQFQAFDGQCHSILASYLAHRSSVDGKWLDREWPKIKLSMDYLIENWDDDENGMLVGAQHGMDSMHGGTSSWMGGMYLAALAAAEQMALIQGDEDSAVRYRRILRIGAKNQDEKLFNGEYFIQIPDRKPRKDYRTGCYTDQMLGQWWAHLLDLGWIYPPDHVRSAMESLFKYNLRTDFYGFEQSPRKFVVDNEPAMVQCTWPRGGRPDPEHTILHADEVKVGISYPVAALMVYSGLNTEGFGVARANADRYDGRLRTDVTDNAWSALGRSGNPFGDDCAGKFYVRALSAWSLLLACQGQIFDGPRGILGFDPNWQPEDHVSFFTASEGWGVFSQQRQGKRQREKIELDWGTLRLSQLVFALPADATPAKVNVQSAGKALEVTHAMKGRRVYIDLATVITLRAGEALEVTIEVE